MGGIVIQGPDGIYPKVDPALLKDNAAQIAENCKLDSGDIVPLNGHLQVATNLAKGSPLSIFGIIYQGTLYFLHWLTVVNATYAMGDSDERGTIVYTGDGEPAVTSEEMAIDGTDTVNGIQRFPSGELQPAGHYPRASYILGVPKPLLKPVVFLSGSPSGQKETRQYVYTFYDNWKQESAPSPVSDPVVGSEDNDWQLSFIETPQVLNVINVNCGYVRNRTPDGYVDIFCEDPRHYFLAGHSLTLFGFPSPWTALNAVWTVKSVKEKVTRITHYEYINTGDLIRLYVDDVSDFEIGDAPVVYLDSTGAFEDGNFVITGISTTSSYINVQNVVPNGTVAKTATDFMSYVSLVKFSIPLSSASASGYILTGEARRKRPYNLSNAHCGVRIYRQTGSDLNFYLVFDLKTSQIVLNSPLGSGGGAPVDARRANKAVKLITEGWDMPPGYLKGIKANPFGYMVAWNSKTRRDLLLSAWRAYWAWPTSEDLNYRQAAQHEILAVDVVGGTVVVLTKGWSYLGDGSHPSTFSMAHRPHPYPCRSSASVVSTLRGVVYASDQGYVLDGPALPEPVLLTDAHYDKWKWDKDVVQQSVIGVYYRGSYITFWPTNKGHILHPTGQLTTHTQPATCAFYHPETGKAYFAVADDVFEWEGDAATFQTQRWKSKKFRLPAPQMFLAYQVFGDFVQPLTATPDTVTLKHYGEGVLSHTASVTSATMGRLPSGKRSREHEIEITSKSRVTYIAVNQNKQGLKGM
jgi:hypothetical protein